LTGARSSRENGSIAAFPGESGFVGRALGWQGVAFCWGFDDLGFYDWGFDDWSFDDWGFDADAFFGEGDGRLFLNRFNLIRRDGCACGGTRSARSSGRPRSGWVP
jgi:hypothetical protein